ncbi:BTB/POZ and MATH domain-containing protein 1-like [Hordeum vulgare subsp. vulgare]|uniref:BTB domain-containing protein n=1 Tax=Hordeum vulgare subsp. vulgare TaxID=112509 RepID=A0A8I7BCN6_HORVV|nr:BTB/POZ and MATH domain-containing protein 1-like [Hordeum vulgare subsp. vulgare]
MSSTSAGGKPLRSSIVADDVRGHHLLTIHGYSRTKVTPTGECARSRPFIIGGHRWCMEYYPNGVCDEVADCVSLSLVLDEDVAVAVKVLHGMCLVDEADDAEQSAATPLVDRFPSRGVASYTTFITRVDLESSKYLRNDSFTIRCDIVLVHDVRAEGHAAAFVPMPPCDLRQDLGELLASEKGADVVFEVGGETVAAHRWMLAARSPVFAAALFGPMREGNAATAGAVVRVEDMDAEVFKALLYYAYTGLMPEAHKDDHDVTCQHLLVAADRYDIKRLKLICEENLCEYINVGSAAVILALAEQHHCVRLKKACLRFLANPANRRAVVATDGFQHLSRSCPSLMIELIATFAV